jgi:4-carboxymuconolactone decarboxylase
MTRAIAHSSVRPAGWLARAAADASGRSFGRTGRKVAQMSASEVDMVVDQATCDVLTALALGDSGVLGEATDLREQLRAESSLDPKTFALVKIAALVALDAPPASYIWQVRGAVEAGASAREILGVLTAVAPQTGMTRVVAAAPEIMVALGLELPEGTDG